MQPTPYTNAAGEQTLIPNSTEQSGGELSIGHGVENLPRWARTQLRQAKLGQSQARTNAALAEDSWSVLDSTVYDTFEATSVFVQDLRDAGLVHNADFMAEFDFWQTRDSHGSATVGQHVEATTSDGAVTHGKDGSPIPAIYDDFTIRYREGAAQEAQSAPDEDIDDAGIDAATRNVTEAIERLFIGDEELEYGVNDGQDIVDLQGIMTHDEIPSISASGDWEDDPTEARDDVRSMRSVLKNDNLVRPGNVGYWMYVGTNWYDAMDDYELVGENDQPTGDTIRDAVADLSNIERVRELDFLDPNSAFMFRPTQDVIQAGIANDLQTLQWDGPFTENYTVLGSMYPRIKKTKAGQFGICTISA